jgi:hypothetical protein
MSKPVFLSVMVALSLLSFLGFFAPLQARVIRHSVGRAAVPTLNVESGCRDVSYLNSIDKTVNYSNCLAEERTARAELQNEWSSFSASVHEQCIYLVTAPAIPSYVTLQGCLHMSRDAKNLPISNPGDGTRGNPQ